MIKDGIQTNKIFVTGNTVIDALLDVAGNVKNKNIKIEGYTVSERKIILLTGHRRENFGDGFVNICNALKEIAHKHSDIDIVYPVHLNPNVINPVHEILSGVKMYI